MRMSEREFAVSSNNITSGKGHTDGADTEKKTIYYSRDYRHLYRAGISYVLQLMLILVPLVVLYLLSYNRISYYFSQYAAKAIHMITGKEVLLNEVDFFPVFGGVYCVEMNGVTPSFTVSFFNFVIALILIIIFSMIKTKKKHLTVFIAIGLYIHAFSSFYFIFFADKFPYDMNSYSVLYMKQQMIVWLMIIVVYYLSTSLITHMLLERIISFIGIVLVSGIFGFTRYIIYMSILSKCSYIYMASLYFTFGVLFDFMVMIAVFSLFMRRASRKFQNKYEGELWKWS